MYFRNSLTSCCSYSSWLSCMMTITEASLSFIFLTNVAVNIQDEDSKLYKVYLVFEHTKNVFLNPQVTCNFILIVSSGSAEFISAHIYCFIFSFCRDRWPSKFIMLLPQ